MMASPDTPGRCTLPANILHRYNYQNRRKIDFDTNLELGIKLSG